MKFLRFNEGGEKYIDWGRKRSNILVLRGRGIFGELVGVIGDMLFFELGC